MALKDRPILQNKAQLNWTEEELRAFATAHEKQKLADHNPKLVRAISRAAQTFTQ